MLYAVNGVVQEVGVSLEFTPDEMKRLRFLVWLDEHGKFYPQRKEHSGEGASTQRMDGTAHGTSDMHHNQR